MEIPLTPDRSRQRNVSLYQKVQGYSMCVRACVRARALLLQTQQLKSKNKFLFNKFNKVANITKRNANITKRNLITMSDATFYQLLLLFGPNRLVFLSVRMGGGDPSAPNGRIFVKI